MARNILIFIAWFIVLLAAWLRIPLVWGSVKLGGIEFKPLGFARLCFVSEPQWVWVGIARHRDQLPAAVAWDGHKLTFQSWRRDGN